jgi:hypothetical protein
VAQLAAAILAIAALVFLTKVAILLLFLAGLIFRTKETLGLIAFLGICALLNSYPIVGIGVLGVIAALVIHKMVSRKSGDPPDEPTD